MSSSAVVTMFTHAIRHTVSCQTYYNDCLAHMYTSDLEAATYGWKYGGISIPSGRQLNAIRRRQSAANK